MKKMKSLLLSLLGIYFLFLPAGLSAQSADVPSDVDALRDIKIEHSVDSSIVSINIQSSLSSEQTLSDIHMSGKVDQRGKLRSLSISFCADADFVPSGEAEIIVSEKDSITLYSSSIQRRNESEKISYTLTYLSGLDTVIRDNVGRPKKTVFIDIFSKTNKAERMGIPMEFFTLLGSPGR